MHISEKIDHLVVVMFENRSFDNLLGTLRHPVDGDTAFDGLPDGWALPHSYHGQKLSPWFPAEQDVKGSGPSHHHASTLRQLVGPVEDWEAEYGKPHPYRRVRKNWPDLLAQKRTNRGFIWDYKRFEKAKYPARVMGTWDDSYIPAIWQLARLYGVCQRWFASLPGMTQPNRLFSLCGQSFGWVNNAPFPSVRQAPRGSTVFAKLEEAGVRWRIYADWSGLTPLLSKDARNARRRHHRNRFFEHARQGKLPQFSFVEPGNGIPNQSMHPGGLQEGPAVLQRGDDFLADVYNALRSNEEKWKNTLLIVTWDEHGGFADHVPPPTGVTPPKGGAGDMGFDFTMFGARVPALVISPWVRKGLLDDTDRDHTTILSTVRELYGLKEPFSDREASMPSLSSLLADERSDPADQPLQVARTSGRDAEALNAMDRDLGPLDEFQRDIASAMVYVALQENVDLGTIGNQDLAEWTVRDFHWVGVKLAPVLAMPDDDEDD